MCIQIQACRAAQAAPLHIDIWLARSIAMGSGQLDHGGLAMINLRAATICMHLIHALSVSALHISCQWPFHQICSSLGVADSLALDLE